MRFPFILIAALAIAGCSSPPAGTPPEAADAAAGDDVNILAGWETPRAEIPARPDCTDIDPALLVPVPQASRPDALARLAQAPAVPLTDGAAAGLIAFRPSGGDGLATALLGARLGQMRERKRLQMEQHIGGWSAADEADLAALAARIEAGGSRQLRPFLVRAIAKWEVNGHLSACSHGDELYLRHGSLGHRVPPSTRLPTIVFLPRLPTRVYATWQMAE